MLRIDLDRQLGQLQQEVISLAEIVDKATMRSVEALKQRDLTESQQLVQEDDYIDQKRYEIEDRCVDLIATQQPMAGDLRAIIALLHITVELERIGDYAEGIAKISLLMGDEPPLKPLIDIPRMAEKATTMLRNSMDSLVSRDTIKANQVLKDDDEVDLLYDQVYRELLVFMLQNPQTIQRATYLLWAAHDLERIADRATNIAERVIFLVTGKMVESNKSTE
ncbi:MAG: phosphate transport system regulatory protein PhoU [Chloroflexi bacterium]|nr:phosphate transport system regulatory protein PhoU [Chloroflexota bacterium]